MQHVLLIVDTQPTFCEGGSLAVNGGNATAEAIGEYYQIMGRRYDYVATTQDWHINPGSHFSEEPDYIDTWPPHAVAGTAEAELHPALAGVKPDIKILKGAYCAAYSGFEGEDENGHGLAQALQLAGYLPENTQLDIAGLAESHCVCDTALDARQLGYSVRILRDLTAPISPELGAEARVRMINAGAQYVDSRQAAIDLF